MGLTFTFNFMKYDLTSRGYCALGLDIAGRIDQADEKLFQLLLTNPNHVLSSLLPDKTDQQYNLTARCQERQLVDKSNNITVHMLNESY